MRYRVIQEHDRRYPIRLMCRALAVSPAGIMRGADVPESRRAAANRTLLVTIRVLHQDSRQTYGSPSIWRALRKQGHQVGRASRGAADAPRWPPGQDREEVAGHDVLVARLARGGKHA
ncbi:MAG: IS3 family transposase [Nitrospira sp.]|nr:IS3 family transposase [Nitrospira sp.]